MARGPSRSLHYLVSGEVAVPEASDTWEGLLARNPIDLLSAQIRVGVALSSLYGSHSSTGGKAKHRSMGWCTGNGTEGDANYSCWPLSSLLRGEMVATTVRDPGP